MSEERARKIKLILFDVDGVMTDGTIWLFPAPAGAQQSVEEHAACMAAGEAGYDDSMAVWEVENEAASSLLSSLQPFLVTAVGPGVPSPALAGHPA